MPGVIVCSECAENGNTHARAYITEYRDYWCPTCHNYSDLPAQTKIEQWGDEE